MSRRTLVKISLGAAVVGAITLLLGCSSKPAKAAPAKPAPVIALPAPPPAPPPEKLPPVMLGIDVLEAEGFKAVAGKKLGLLTHPAGVNRRGESTVDVLRRAPGVKLVALYAPEHGIDGTIKAGENFKDSVDRRTGLPVRALYGQGLDRAKAMVKGLDALVVDLQDIGVRSYTFTVILRAAMEACFSTGVEVIVLDRPNPLGGLKVDGPPLDMENTSGVGAFPHMPYVHGLTIGEIALMAKNGSSVLVQLPASSGMALTSAVREKGRLTVVPMRGWNRAMRWPDTGLRWIPTSGGIPTFEAAIGYAMIGLGCEETPWVQLAAPGGAGARGIGYPKKTPEEIIKAMEAYKLPGLRFVKRPAPGPDGKPGAGVYVEITDWDSWNPTELSFYLHKQAAKWSSLNPFTGLTGKEERKFCIHVGSTRYLEALKRDGARVDVAGFFKKWTDQARIYQEQTKKFRLYP